MDRFLGIYPKDQLASNVSWRESARRAELEPFRVQVGGDVLAPAGRRS